MTKTKKKLQFNKLDGLQRTIFLYLIKVAKEKTKNIFIIQVCVFSDRKQKTC